ncbi:MAG: hypothetical protein ACE5KF_07060 [Kiloniellaceae bacterium]
MISPLQFRRYVIRPAIRRLGLDSEAAEWLLLGTALVESDLTWLVQKGGGPALGLYQIEPRTERDLWRNYLDHRAALAARVRSLMTGQARTQQLVTNLAYATAIARLIYRRVPEPLPAADDLPGLARYWKAHFNTAAGTGTPRTFMRRMEPFRNGPIERRDL